MWEFIKIILGILATLYACASWIYMIEDIWDWYDAVENFWFLLTGAVAICWATYGVSCWFGIIYLVVAAICSLILLCDESYDSFHFVYLLVIGVILIVGIWSDFSYKNKIAWDTENYETQVIEYPVMGVSGEHLIIKVISENGETTLKSIALNNVEWKTESVLMPYVYQEKYIYTKYDYNKEPPEIVEKGRENRSKYILYGTEKQIQELLGSKVSFNFEQ